MFVPGDKVRCVDAHNTQQRLESGKVYSVFAVRRVAFGDEHEEILVQGEVIFWDAMRFIKE